MISSKDSRALSIPRKPSRSSFSIARRYCSSTVVAQAGDATAAARKKASAVAVRRVFNS
jgi:hypothetical protein